MIPKVLQTTMEGLPWSLREQVIGYAKSVDDALPEIFREARRDFDRVLGDQIVFFAGVKKLYSIVGASYWTLDNSGKLLETLEVSSIRAGGLDLTRGGDLHHRLQALVNSFDKALEKDNVRQYLNLDYKTLIEVFSNDERR
jgi:hypothetical protein